MARIAAKRKMAKIRCRKREEGKKEFVNSYSEGVLPSLALSFVQLVAGKDCLVKSNIRSGHLPPSNGFSYPRFPGNVCPNGITPFLYRPSLTGEQSSIVPEKQHSHTIQNPQTRKNKKIIIRQTQFAPVLVSLG